MNRLAQLALQARYNQWMNDKLYQAAARLPEAVLQQDRGAFFGSLFGTLNHIVVADTLWLQRFGQHPANFAALQPLQAMAAPTSLNGLLFDQLPALARGDSCWTKSSSAYAARSTTAILISRWPITTPVASRSARTSTPFCCTSSTTRPIIAVRPPPCCPSWARTSASPT